MKIVEPGFEILTPLIGADVLRRIEAAGRTCYKSEGSLAEDSPAEFVQMILERGHETVIEHESVSVRIVCDRGVSHEIVRHRLASYSQESTRYCNYSKDKHGGEVTFIRPCFWNAASSGVGEEDLQHQNGARWYQWREAVAAAESRYLRLLQLGASPQEARSVLPNSLKTEIVMTCNLREWRHFFKLRTAKAAHPQMRQIARPMLAAFRELIPVVFDDVGVAMNCRCTVQLMTDVNWE